MLDRAAIASASWVRHRQVQEPANLFQIRATLVAVDKVDHTRPVRRRQGAQLCDILLVLTFWSQGDRNHVTGTELPDVEPDPAAPRVEGSVVFTGRPSCGEDHQLVLEMGDNRTTLGALCRPARSILRPDRK